MGQAISRSLERRSGLSGRQNGGTTASNEATSTANTSVAAEAGSTSSSNAAATEPKTTSEAPATTTPTSTSTPAPVTSTSTVVQTTVTTPVQTSTTTAQQVSSTTAAASTSSTSIPASSSKSASSSSSSSSSNQARNSTVSSTTSIPASASQAATHSNASILGPSSSSDSFSAASTSSVQTSTFSTYSAPPISTTPISVVYKTVSTFVTSSTATSSIQPFYSGTGALLLGSCATPEYTLVEGPKTVYYAPFVGCVGDRLNCCPYVAATTTSIADSFPQPSVASQATLAKCPSDYYNVNGGCCPSGFLPYSVVLGGETPCFSTLPAALTPPPLTAGITTDSSSKPTAAVVNIVYAKQYAVSSTHLAGSSNTSSGPSAGSIAGIVFGVLLAVAVVVGLTWFLIRGHRQKRAQMREIKHSLHPSIGTGMSVVPTDPSHSRSGSRGAILEAISELGDAQKVRDNKLDKAGFGTATNDDIEDPAYYRGFMRSPPPPPQSPLSPPLSPPKEYQEKGYLAMETGYAQPQPRQHQQRTISPPALVRPAYPPPRPLVAGNGFQQFHMPIPPPPPTQPPPPYAGAQAVQPVQGAPVARGNSRSSSGRRPNRSRSGRNRAGSTAIQEDSDLPLHLVGQRQASVREANYGHTRQPSADSGSFYGDEEEEDEESGAGFGLRPLHAPGRKYQLSENF